MSMTTTARPPKGGPASYEAPARTTTPTRDRRLLIAGVLVVIVLAVIGVVALRARLAGSPALVTQPIVRGTLLQTVSSSGTINPQDTVNIGTQVSGTLGEVNVDFNSRVHVGQVLARLDPSSFQAALDQARAQLAQAQAQAAAGGATARGSSANVNVSAANVLAARANSSALAATANSASAAVQSADAQVRRAQSADALAQQTVSRDMQLISSGYISQTQLETDRSNAAAAQAALESARVSAEQARLAAVAAARQVQASEQQIASQSASAMVSATQAESSAATAQASQASVAIARAQVQNAELNLQRTVITSPVDGVVIARNVSVGQTVAASFQTPTLFMIAKNLNKMEADLAVGEPDIGSIRPGQSIGFTVLAYPNRTYHGVVSQVRKNPTTVQNVVTYTVVTLVDNPDGTLLPGMTANASVHVAKAQNALIVPLAALQWHPSGSHSGNHAGGTHRQSSGASAAGSPWGRTLGGTNELIATGNRGSVYLYRDGNLTRVRVHIDLTQGAQAAISLADDTTTLNAGDPVVVGDASASSDTGGSARGQSPLGGGPGIGRALR